MNNLYVFAIGGSGERVMKSLVMMLAAGMPIGAKNLIPVFVDNDVKSKALTSCLDLIKYYRSNPQKEKTDKVGLHELCNRVEFGKPSFAHVNIGAPVILNVAGAHIGNLDKIIGTLNLKDSYEDSVNEEKNLLFTEDDLEMPLTVGFVGNPNVGSVVLNSLSLQGDEFNTIYGDAGSSDGVFVIGSLFGGTGAAGFPLIVNKFMSDDNTHHPLLGGVAVLPYFNLKEGDQTGGNLIDTKRFDVNSDTFSSKTRAALMYYDEYMRNMDYMYYVGDSQKRSLYDHYVGGEKQENPYNIIEVLAALSVVNFSNKDTSRHPDQVVYQLPVWDFNKETMANVTSIRNKDLKRNLVKFQMMKTMFENPDFIKWNIEEGHEFVRNILFTEEMRKAILKEEELSKYPLAWGLHNLFQMWDKWMGELGDEKRVKRQLRIFNSEAGSVVTKENISQFFFSDNNFGIAKTETVREGPIFNRHEVTRALSPKIEDAMLKSYRSLGVKSNTARPEMALSTLLLVISNALDNVIDNYCDL